MQGRIKYDVMSKNELSLFKDRMEQLLIRRGIHTDHTKLKEELEQAGCIVDGDTVRFPAEVIKKAISTVPKEFTLFAPDETYNISASGRQFLYENLHRSTVLSAGERSETLYHTG